MTHEQTGHGQMQDVHSLILSANARHARGNPGWPIVRVDTRARPAREGAST